MADATAQTDDATVTVAAKGKFDTGYRKALENGHTIEDLPEGTGFAPGVYAVCGGCGATLRYYQGRLCGEAYSATCRVAAPTALTPTPPNQMYSNAELAEQRQERLENATSLNDWRDEILEYARLKGWLTQPQDASVGELIALMHTELSEAFEEYRNGHLPNHTYYKTVQSDTHGTVYKPEGMASELVDVIIRILHFCGIFGIDVDSMIREKHEYNLTRPYRHGGKVA